MFLSESGAKSQLGTSLHRRNVSRPDIFPLPGNYCAVSLYCRPTMCDRTQPGAQGPYAQTMMCVQLM